MATAPTPAPAPAPKMTEKEERRLLALLLVNWLHGDRHYDADVRAATVKLLESMGEDGAEMLARLEGREPPPVKEAA